MWDRLASLQNKLSEDNQWSIGGFLSFASQELTGYNFEKDTRKRNGGEKNWHKNAEKLIECLRIGPAKSLGAQMRQEREGGRERERERQRERERREREREREHSKPRAIQGPAHSYPKTPSCPPPSPPHPRLHPCELSRLSCYKREREREVWPQMCVSSTAVLNARPHSPPPLTPPFILPPPPITSPPVMPPSSFPRFA